MSADDLARLTFFVTLVAGISNLVLAFLTGIYVFLTRQMVIQMRTARDPSVFIDLEFPDGEARLAIGNSGQSPAKNVRFSISEDIPWGAHPHARSKSLKSLDVIRNGLSFLPPGRTLKYMIGWVDWDALKGISPLIDVKITFENDSKSGFARDYQIDLSQFAEVARDTYRDSSLEVAKAIRDAEQNRSLTESTRHLSRQLFRSTKVCPMCGSSIPKVAKKCPRCQEFLPEESAASLS